MAQLPEMPRKPELWVDGTGVGKAVVDIFREAKMNPVSVAITAGDRVNRISATEVRVPKRELASLVQACLQTGRIEVARELHLSRTLEDELSNFKVRISSTTGNETYEGRSGVHDDLVLALALAVFAAEKRNDAPGAACLEIARRELAKMRGKDPEAELPAKPSYQPGSAAWQAEQDELRSRER